MVPPKQVLAQNYIWSPENTEKELKHGDWVEQNINFLISLCLGSVWNLGVGLDGGQSFVQPPNPANLAQPRWSHTSWSSFSKAINWHNWGHFFTPTGNSASHCWPALNAPWRDWKHDPGETHLPQKSQGPVKPAVAWTSEDWKQRTKSKGQTKTHRKTGGDSSRKAFCCSSPPTRAALRVWSADPDSPPRFLPEVFCCSHIKSISRGSVSTLAASDYSTGQFSLTCSCPHRDIQGVYLYFPA